MILLSRPFLMVWILLLFSEFLLITDSQHVIFESIGQMAGAISYQHAKLTLNLSSIFNQFEKYESALDALKVNLSAPVTLRLRDKDRATFVGEPEITIGSIVRDVRRMNLETITLHQEEVAEMSELIDTLRNILPEVGEAPDSVPPIRAGRSADFKKAKKRVSTIGKIFSAASKVAGIFSGGATSVFNFLGLPFGIFGTYMGLYNNAQIDQVRKELYTVIDSHNRLVEVVELQDQAISTIAAEIQDLTAVLHLTILQNPGYTTTRLSRIENQLKHRIEIAVHTIQQAQHRRLAVDFLSAQQLNILFSKLVQQADQNGCQLLVRHRSDLFQLETSYFFDGADVHLLLHVPMVPRDSLLRLFKLHPFPLPLSGSHVMVPAVREDILAISSGFKRYSAQFSATDLLGCHVINNIYLCERHGVLNSDLNTTCLGSLYTQDFDAVKKLCELEIHKTGEIVYQLLNNWYLIYSPSVQTVPISCLNGTQSEKHLSKGTSRVYISPGCRAHLATHLIISDISIKLDTDLLHFEWKWDAISLGDLDSSVITPQLALLEENGLFRPTLSDLHELKLHQKQGIHWWTTLANFVGNAVMMFIFCVTAVYLAFRFYRFRQNQKAQTIPAEDENL